jgi:hypothetical protein
MGEFGSFPDIIRAVTDVYGLLALSVLVIGTLAWKMNADAAPNVRAVIFLAILASFVLCLYLALTHNRGNKMPEPVRPAPEAQTGAVMLFPDSDRRLLTASDLAGLDAEQLRLARNEIFARRGRRFVDPALRAHFQQFDWYQPTSTEVALNRIEVTNVEAIRRAEAR